jgi:hypothetical protein
VSGPGAGLTRLEKVVEQQVSKTATVVGVPSIRSWWLQLQHEKKFTLRKEFFTFPLAGG